MREVSDNRKNFIICFLILAVIVGAVWYIRPEQSVSTVAPVSERSKDQQSVVRVGSISNNVKEETAIFKPLVEYLAKSLQSAGIKDCKLVVAKNINEMSDLLRRGEVDLYIDSPFPALKVSELSGAEPALRRWKKGNSSYRSVIFTRKDSGVNSLGDLRGRYIIFENEFSTSGYLMPKFMLREAKLSPKMSENLGAAVSAPDIGYVFSQGDENTVHWVLENKAAAGALEKEKLFTLAGARINEISILQESIEIPRQVVVYRHDLGPHIRDAIDRTLLAMDQGTEGKKVLNAFEKTAKFDKFPEGAAAALKPVKQIMQIMENEIK